LARVAAARTPREKGPAQNVERLARPLSGASQNGYLIAVRRFFGWLVKVRRWPTNPALEVELVEQVKTYTRRALAREDALRLLATAPLERRAVYAVAMTTGLRRGELAALTWATVDLAEGWVRLPGRATKNRTDAELRLPPSVVAV